MTAPEPDIPDADVPEIGLEAPPLGAGRTSRVWRGRLRAPFGGLPEGAEVAVKVLRPELVDDETARSTLAHEREASRAVQHPGLARARFLGDGTRTPAPSAAEGHDVEDAGARRPWLLLDLVPGPTLPEIMQSAGPGAPREPLPEPLVRRIGARVARALAALHAGGWVHGDVKADNVRLDADGAAVLVDLGFARRAGSPDAPLGTPRYVAPERANGGAPVATADLFALGCLMFELGVGAPPAESESELAALRAGRVPAPSDLVPRLAPLFDAVTLELLSTSPAARPTALEIAEVLEEGEGSAWWRDCLRFDPLARRDTVAWSGQHVLPLVGRDAELERLAAAWRATAAGEGAAVLLTGERGVGKSRLVAEFVHRLRRTEDPALYLYGRCDATGDERPGAPLLKIVRRWLHLPSGATPGARSRALLGATVSAEVGRTLLGALQPDAEDSGADMAESVALGEWLIALGRAQPAIVFLDDVHLAGPATLEALRMVARDLASTRLLLVLGQRRRGESARRGDLADVLDRLQERAVSIELAGIDPDATLELIEGVFHHSAPRMRIARILHQRTEGVPGRIGEVLRLARQRGLVRPSPPPGRGLELRGAPEDLPRPESPRVAAVERLRALPGRERVWLERAAVVGARIDPALLAEAWPGSSAAARDRALAGLARANWLVPVGAQFRFALPVDRQETLAAMRPRAQRRAHAAVAAALTAREEAAGKAPSYRRAFHLRLARDVPALLAVLPGLLRRMRDTGHPHRRATLAGWGLEAMDERPLAERDSGLRRDLLEALADAADRLGEREEQRAALEALGELEVDVETEAHLAARVYVLHARHAVGGGRFGLARGFLRNAEELGERAHRGHHATTESDRARLAADRAEIARLLAKIATERGDYDAALTHAKRARELATTPLDEAFSALAAAEIEIHEGRLEPALRRLAAARRSLRVTGGGLAERAARAATNLLTGRTWRLVGRPYRAARALERAAELAVQAGEGRVEVEVGARLGRLLADVHEERRAELLLRDALFNARRIEDRRGEALAALFLGVFLAEQGERDAPALVTRARRLASELGSSRVEALALAVEARLLVQAGEIDAAHRLASDGWTLVERHGAELPDRIVIGGTLALVHDLRGEPGAAEELERALRARMERDNARLTSTLLRQRHRRWTAALLVTARSSEGVLYPRVHLRGLDRD